MDRILDRALNKACRADDEKRGRKPKTAAKKIEDEPEQEPDANAIVQRVLKAWKDKDYFGLLELPLPTVDALNKPVWPCTSGDVSRAYRKLSVLLHPDKNPGADARQAFEYLNEAHRMLKDPSRLEEVLREAAVSARERQERAEAAASVEERRTINAAKVEQAKQLRHQEGKAFESEIMKQARQRMEEAKRKRQLSSRPTRVGEDGKDSLWRADEESDDEQERQVKQQKARRRPVFI